MNDELRQAIIKAAEGTGHSVFGASGSPGWAFCADYLAANHGKADRGSADAAEGTVGHMVGETWLNRVKTILAEESATGCPPIPEVIATAEPRDLIGTKHEVDGFEIEVTEDMLGYIRQYVEWCTETPGEHYIETWVDFSDLTPIPGQGGTADYAACEFGKLTITDLKYGMGIQVFAEKNTQLLLYAYAFFNRYDWLYDFQEIVIRIAQPRRDHFDTWTISRDALLDFAGWIAVRAAKAWEGGERAPSEKSCRYCRDVECAARLAALHADTDDVFEDLTVIDGQYSVVSENAMVVAKQALDTGWAPDAADPATLSTLQLEKLLRLRKLIEKWMAQIESELESRAADGVELQLFKLVDGRQGNREFESEEAALEIAQQLGVSPLLLYKTKILSPNQFEDVVRLQLGISKKRAGELINPVVIRAAGRQTLAPITDERDAQSPDDIFEDYTLEGL